MSAGGHRGLGGGLFGKQSVTNTEVYLNLTPLMDVMSNILFFLLAAFGASIIAIVPTMLPVQAEGDAGPDVPETDKVTLTVRADATGLGVDCDNPAFTKQDLQVCKVRLPKIGGEYDAKGFTATLTRVKERFPGSSTMILVPDDSLHYEVIVYLMDAARESKQADGRKKILFPEVVLSKLVTAQDLEGH